MQHKLYGVLGVSPGADLTEIKRAYRSKSLQLHPDRPGGCEERFKELNEAYEVLSDPERRRRYDTSGDATARTPRGTRTPDVFGVFEGRRARSKTCSMAFRMKVSLGELYTGATRKLAITRRTLCGECGGGGFRPGATKHACADCGGRGVVFATRQLAPGIKQRVQARCDACSGSGLVASVEDRCGGCTNGAVMQRSVVVIEIKRGLRDGQTILLANQGNQLPGQLPGDVIVTIAQERHPVFDRQGDHLILRQTIGLREALCGGTVVNVKALDGRVLRAATRPGEVLAQGACRSIPHEGMPQYNSNADEKGHLCVRFEVSFPTSLDAASVAAISVALRERDEGDEVSPDAETDGGAGRSALDDFVPAGVTL